MMLSLLILFTLLQLADGYSTFVLLSRGGRELNLPLAWTFDRIGLIPGLLLYKGACIAGGIALHAMDATPVLAALCVLYAGVVWHNIRQMEGQNNG